MSERKGLAYEMKSFIKQAHRNNNTKKTYTKHADRFCAYVKSCGLTANDVRDNPIETLQKYVISLSAKGLSPDTIHTYLSFPCAFFDINMNSLTKPKRMTVDIRKSRGNNMNPQGVHEAIQARFARVVEFQRRVGIRRAELARLEGNNLKQDESGHLCVEVVKGKGGKYQLQRILPQDIDFVCQYFDGSTNRLFSEEEMNNKIDFHAMRSAKARMAYDYYLQQTTTPEGRKRLQEAIIDRYTSYNKRYLYSDRNVAALVEFEKEMQGEYKLRGSTATVARKKGRALTYDKTALMAVSVFHLSHWRCDVTVRNYLLA